jgi:hypothetical protein
MHYAQQWKALSARIQGLGKAAELHAIYQSDALGRSKHLRAHCQQILADLEAFSGRHRNALAPLAADAISRVLSKAGPIISDGSGGSLADERVWAGLVFLAAFETEFSYLLSDTQEIIRAQADRAFVHLQRMIVVDAEFRGKWQEAFAAGETECEQLGAVHLLWHGIWAFKAYTAGARTDLVMQEPITDATLIERAAQGLVLTEWKRAKSPKDADAFTRARGQAADYASGALAGNELANYRYAVVVSEQQLDTPPDLRQGDVTYRHINIAIRPMTPSRKSAR